MWTPVPNTEMVESFRELARKELGLELSMEDAREVATRLIKFRLMKLRTGEDPFPEEGGS